MSGSKSEPTPEFVLLLLLIFIFAILWLIWYFFKSPILESLRWLRYTELWTVSLFTDKREACLHWLKAVKFGEAPPTLEIVGWTQQCFGANYLASLPPDSITNYYHLSATSMADIERLVTIYDHWFLGAFFGGMGGYIIFFSPRMKFRTRHTLESFIRVQAKMWPVIAPIVNFNPAHFSARRPGDAVPDKLPPFAEALSPEEWIAWHRIPVTNNIPDREAVRRAFLLQLGPRWNGIETVAPYMQALFAAFALKGAQKREESDDLLGQLSLCWSVKDGLKMPGKLVSRIQTVIRDSEIGGRTLEVANQHAYRTTAMLGTLRWARFQGGVLAPAQFLWLRAVDRGLWYPLNNLGRRSFHTEGAGAMAHFMAEQSAKKPLPIPRIDTAIVTLNQYLAERGQPIPPREDGAAKAKR